MSIQLSLNLFSAVFPKKAVLNYNQSIAQLLFENLTIVIGRIKEDILW